MSVLKSLLVLGSWF